MKYKIFGAGMIRGYNFTKEKLEELFDSKESEAIFAHTSEYDNKEEILKLGKFKNFEIKNDGVYAEINLNSIGQTLKENGIIKGISVELDRATKKLKRVALLPIFQTPAINGAEFKESEMILEFKRSDEEVNEKEIRADERKKVIEEMKSEFSKTKADLEEEFKTKLEAKEKEAEEKIEEFKKAEALNSKKEKFKAILEDKLPKVAIKGYEFALERATDSEDEIFKVIEDLKKSELKEKLVDSFKKTDEDKKKNKEDINKQYYEFL